jgi:hypothetical protein
MPESPTSALVTLPPSTTSSSKIPITDIVSGIKSEDVKPRVDRPWPEFTDEETEQFPAVTRRNFWCIQRHQARGRCHCALVLSCAIKLTRPSTALRSAYTARRRNAKLGGAQGSSRYVLLQARISAEGRGWIDRG